MAALILIFAIFFLSGPIYSLEVSQEELIGDSPSIGSRDAPLSIIEFVDYQ